MKHSFREAAILFPKNRNSLLASLIIIFGLMTILSGGRSLFTESGLNTRGNIVPLVLWFNFIAGFFYIMAGVLVLRLKPAGKNLTLLIATLNSVVLIYLLAHIFQGGLFEMKTLVAMSFRTLVWIAFSIYVQKHISP